VRRRLKAEIGTRFHELRALRDTSEPVYICCVSRPFLGEERSGKIATRTCSRASANKMTATRSESDCIIGAKQQNSAHGEEIADTLETASMLIAALVAEFSIAQDCIRIEILMQKTTDGTRH
jgi:hypothetical protein